MGLEKEWRLTEGGIGVGTIVFTTESPMQHVKKGILYLASLGPDITPPAPSHSTKRCTFNHSRMYTLGGLRDCVIQNICVERYEAHSRKVV